MAVTRSRPPVGRRPFAGRLALVAIAALAMAGCSSAGSSPGGGQPGGSPPPAPVTTPDEAAARVIEEHPEFEGLGPRDPDLIGQCCWYEATEAGGGYEVTIEVGWGDCPAGCIDRHRWEFAVSSDGAVELVEESGSSLEPGILPPR